VSIVRAHPKQDSTGLCPTCYPDCEKSTATDSEGRFAIKDVDANLTFDLLLAGPGYESRIVTSVDPVRNLNEFTLPYTDEQGSTNLTRIAGVIWDEEGQPVAGCMLNCDRFERNGSTFWGGGDQYLRSLVVTDARGLFATPCDPSVNLVHAKIHARNSASQWFDVTPGKDMIIRLQAGVTVSGKVKQAGQPLAGISLGLTLQEPQWGDDSDGYTTTTGADGSFTFQHVPADHTVTLFARTASLAGRGALANRPFQTEGNHTSVDLGELAAVKGIQVKGRIVPPAGSSLPEKTTLYCSRTGTGDSQNMPIGDDGVFELKDLPPGPLWISFRAQGFKFSKKIPSLDWYNGAIVGTVDKDIPDLVLPLDTGEWRYQEEQQEAPAGTNLQPNNEPLRGAKVESSPGK
jgi:hypothetical protein